MSFNGSGTFVINSAGQPVVTGTVISSTAFNALTADLATGLTSCITKTGESTTTGTIPFATQINSTLATDASSSVTGAIKTAGGMGIAKALWVGTSLNVGAATTLSGVAAVGTTTSASTWLNLGGSTTALSSLRIPAGAGTPAAPVAGDIWSDGTSVFFRNAGGVTKTFQFV